jgi:hypothetical protein
MSNAAQITNADVTAFCGNNAIPRGYKYTIVHISLNKRLARSDIPADERLRILEMLEVHDLDRIWLKTNMVAAIEPMDDRGYEIASEAHKLPEGKVLDVFADRFATFAVLNPSLIAALEMLGAPHPRQGPARGKKVRPTFCVTP